MNRRKNRPQAKKMLTMLLVLPVAVWGAWRAMPTLMQVAAKAAMVSAYCNMPEGSLAMLEERFNSELFGQNEKETPTVPQKPKITYEAPPPNEQEESTAEPEIHEEEALVERDIPPQYRGVIKELQYGADITLPYIPLAAGHLKNTTKLKNEQVQKELDKPLELDITQTDEPQVLIIHTHATEAYEPVNSESFDTRETWRDTDNASNMVQVGKRIADELTAKGIGVIHDDTQHDYPTYNGAYERSAKTVQSWLEEYPSIRVVLDVHRDAIQPADDTIVKATATINGKKAAQVMIITGCDDGTMNVPDWAYNLRFAAALQSTAEGKYEGLMRPIFFCYRKYNMDLTRGSILLEFGSHGNTLKEAEYSGELIGKALAEVFESQWEENIK